MIAELQPSGIEHSEFKVCLTGLRTVIFSNCKLQVWKMSSTDLCEIARNSVLHSGFPHQVRVQGGGS